MKELTKEKLAHATNISKFRVKIKSLATEARIIRSEERKRRGLQNTETWGGYEFVKRTSDLLAHHRMEVVRPEARHTLVAYGFLKGRPYATIERPGEHNKLDIYKVQRILKSLTGESRDREVQNWLMAK